MLTCKWFDNGITDKSFTDIRTEVFVKEQGVPLENEFDEYDLTYPHLVIFLDGKAAATGRFIPYGEKTVKIGRIAVKKEFRKMGFGEKLVAELLKRVEAEGAEKILVGAQTHAVGFYEKCGFTLTDEEEYLEENIPHRNMYRELKRK